MTPLSPADAEVALRSYPRRWRALLGTLDPDDPEAAERLRRPGPGGRSALDAAAEAGTVLAAARDHLHRARTDERPSLATPAPVPAGGATEVLDRIEASSTALADAVAEVPAGDLGRSAELDGAPTTVRALIAEAAARAGALLREAEAALR